MQDRPNYGRQFVLNAKARDQRLQPARGRQAGSPGTRGAFKPQASDNVVSGRSISQSSIDVLAAVLPRPGISRSMMTTPSPCNQRAGDPRANDQRIAADVFAELGPGRIAGCCKLRRVFATLAEVSLWPHADFKPHRGYVGL
jgi:hypothetical protein